MNGYIYFIECGDRGPIKIGYSASKKVKERLVSAQVFNPIRLRLLCIMPGTLDDETKFHTRFADNNIRGEWFARTPELQQIIESCEFLGLYSDEWSSILENHHAWKGENAVDGTKRRRARSRFSLKKCELCHKPGHDRYHKDGNLDNLTSDNIMILCRTCCMKQDGRLDALIANGKKNAEARKLPPRSCSNCSDKVTRVRKSRCRNCYEYLRRHGIDRKKRS